MKRTFLFPVLLINSFAFAQTITAAEMDTLFPPMGTMRKAAIGKVFGEFSATGDSLITQQSFEGKTVFVNFWFELCKPCITELEGLNSLYKQTKDRTNFLFVSFTYEPIEKVKTLREKYGLLYPVYHMEAKDCQRLNRGLGFPTNVLVDASGKINHITFAGAANKKSAEDFLHNEFYPKIIALSQQR